MQRTCSRGHLYDADLYASCPYCNRGTQAIFFGAGGNDGRTEAPSGYQMGGERTQAPSGFQASDTGRTTAPSGFGGQAQSNPGPTVDPRNAGGHRDPSDPGKTEMPESMRRRMQKEKENKTVGYFKKKYGIDPVVGWLVCIEGPEKGKDHRLFSRINTIGRDESNDVVIAGEQTISQKNHVKLGYDPKHNNFTLIPGDGHNLVYLNDAPLYIPQMLNAYDIIEMGETKLIFQPLCSDKFRWPEEKVADKE